MTDFVMIDGRRVACVALTDGRLMLLVAADPTSFGIGATDWRPMAETTIAAADSFRVLIPAGQASHGGYIVNVSDPGTAPLLVDPTGTLGPGVSDAAMPVYPAADASSAPGSWRIPPSKGPVTIRGPAGARFRGFYA